jgi:hypothetical protein
MHADALTIRQTAEYRCELIPACPVRLAFQLAAVLAVEVPNAFVKRIKTPIGWRRRWWWRHIVLADHRIRHEVAYLYDQRIVLSQNFSFVRLGGVCFLVFHSRVLEHNVVRVFLEGNQISHCAVRKSGDGASVIFLG